MHLEAGASGADIDNVAGGRLAFQIGKDGAGLGHPAAGPGPMKAAPIVVLFGRHDEVRDWAFRPVFVTGTRMPAEYAPARGQFDGAF